MKKEAGIRVMRLQAQEHHTLPATTSTQEQSPHSLRRNQPCPHLTSGYQPPEPGENRLQSFKPPGLSALSQQPETDTEVEISVSALSALRHLGIAGPRRGNTPVHLQVAVPGPHPGTATGDMPNSTGKDGKGKRKASS